MSEQIGIREQIKTGGLTVADAITRLSATSEGKRSATYSWLLRKVERAKANEGAKQAQEAKRAKRK